MANLTKLEFVALDITGNNYLSWILDAEIHLDANGLGDTIKEENTASVQNKAKAMIFLHHHLHEDLKTEYRTIKDPLVLWNSLKERFDHQKTVILPKARYEWMHLRLQDFKTVSEYNSALFRFTSVLKLCGENITEADMLEKTFSTFHPLNLLLSQQYREKGFQKYSELISCLLVAEQNNKILLKNHEARPTGSTPFPETNVTIYNRGHASSRGRGQGRGRGRGRGHGREHGQGNYRGGHFKSPHVNLKLTSNVETKGNDKSGSEPKFTKNICYRCRGKNHWSRTCCTPKHLVELYQESLKGKGKKVETNFVSYDDDGNYAYVDTTDVTDYLIPPAENNALVDATTHLDIADFFISPEENN